MRAAFPVLTLLAACHPVYLTEQADLASEREPHHIVTTYEMSTAGRDLGDAMFNDDERAYVTETWGTDQCPQVAVFERHDAAMGILEASMRTPCVPDASAYALTESVSVMGGTLAAGPYVFEEGPAGYTFVVDLDALTPAQSEASLVLAEDQVATFERWGGINVFTRDGDTWIHTQRLPASAHADPLRASDGLFATDEQLYADVDGRWVPVADGLEPLALNGEHIMDADGTLHRWDGQEAHPTGATFDLSDTSFVVLGDQTIAFANVFTDSILTTLDGEVLGEQDVTFGIPNEAAVGSTSLLQPAFGLAWHHFSAPTGAAPVVVDPTFDDRLELSLAKDETFLLEVEVREGAESLEVVLEGDGDADLFLAYDVVPTMRHYDCASYSYGSEEYCYTPYPEVGPHHVMVRGFESASEVTLTVRVR